MQDVIDRATRELAAGDWQFYETLRDAWRAQRCAELATVIETLSRTHGRPPLDIKKPKAWHTAWIARVRERNPLDLHGLLEGLVPQAGPRQASMIASCLDELAAFPDDPQLTLPVIELLALDPASSSWNKVHTRLFKLLELANDPRAIALLEPAIERAKQASTGWSDSMRESLARAGRVREALVEKFPDGVPAAPAFDASELLRTKPSKPLVAIVRVDEIDALYQAMLDDPDDDAKRAVYADALQERGDIRGEIIALHLAGTPDATAKAAKLCEKHRKMLLGGIAKTVIATTAKFEKGFLAECETDVRRQVEADVIFGRAEWATVKRLTFKATGQLSAAMRSLEEVYGVTETAVSALRKIALPRLRVIEMCEAHSLVRGTPTGGLGALATTTGLPSLREVRFRVYNRGYKAEDFAWLTTAPCGQKLERLVVPGEQDARDGWQAILDHHATLREVVLTSYGKVLPLTKQQATAR